MRKKKVITEKELKNNPGASSIDNDAEKETVQDETTLDNSVGKGEDESQKDDLQDGDIQQELAVQKEKYLRLHADYDNYRKRAYKELSNARINSQIDTIVPVLQVFDHFDMAMASTQNAKNLDAIKQGLEMILTEFKKALDEIGIKKVDAVGDDFDPNLHEAVAHEASEEAEGKIIKQWRCGYRMGERMIRPASVVVSSGNSEDDLENE